MEVKIDLSNTKSKTDVLSKFGEVFEFGGPNGNFLNSNSNIKTGWGFNLDALNDSLHYLEVGGIWGTSKKFNFPLSIIISNYKLFCEGDNDTFQKIVDILNYHIIEYSKEGKILKVIYESADAN